MKCIRAAAVGCCVAIICSAFLTFARSEGPTAIVRASFTADGNVNLPVGYRQWVHIGTRYKPVGINILDFEQTKTPEIFNAFVEPTAFAAFQETGKWPGRLADREGIHRGQDRRRMRRQDPALQFAAGLGHLRDWLHGAWHDGERR